MKHCEICGRPTAAVDTLTGCYGHGGGDESEATWPPRNEEEQKIRNETLKRKMQYQLKGKTKCE